MEKSIQNYSVAELKQLIKEKEAEENKIIKTGILRHTLYHIDDINYHLVFDGSYLTKNQLEEQFEEFKSSLLVIPCGTKFVRFNSKDYCWFDDSSLGVEEKSDAWAELHLTDIKDV